MTPQDRPTPIAQGAADRLAELEDRVELLEAANAGLRSRLAQERRAFAQRARDQQAGTSPELQPDGVVVAPPVERAQTLRLRSELEQAQSEIDHLRFELDAVYATRVMRTVAPARRVYAKLRSLAR